MIRSIYSMSSPFYFWFFCLPYCHAYGKSSRCLSHSPQYTNPVFLRVFLLPVRTFGSASLFDSPDTVPYFGHFMSYFRGFIFLSFEPLNRPAHESTAHCSVSFELRESRLARTAGWIWPWRGPRFGRRTCKSNRFTPPHCEALRKAS